MGTAQVCRWCAPKRWVKRAHRAFPGAADYDNGVLDGLCPSTPSNCPLIGRTRFRESVSEHRPLAHSDGRRFAAPVRRWPTSCPAGAEGRIPVLARMSGVDLSAIQTAQRVLAGHTVDTPFLQIKRFRKSPAQKFS